MKLYLYQLDTYLGKCTMIESVIRVEEKPKSYRVKSLADSRLCFYRDIIKKSEIGTIFHTTFGDLIILDTPDKSKVYEILSNEAKRQIDVLEEKVLIRKSGLEVLKNWYSQEAGNGNMD